MTCQFGLTVKQGLMATSSSFAFCAIGTDPCGVLKNTCPESTEARSGVQSLGVAVP